MTPIFSRIWFVKMQHVRAFEISEVSLRKAALMSRACAPTVVSPISPSSSALVTSAATESSTITSRALDRTSVSQIRSASSPELGCETSRSSRSTTSPFAYAGSSACSTSMNAASPPRFCAWAITVRVRVVLPDDSGPKHFDDSAPWKSANSKRAIDQNIASRNDVDVNDLFVAKSHDRAVAVIFRDLLNRQIEILISRDGEFVCAGLLFSFRRHIEITLITSPPTVRQAKSFATKSKGRDLRIRGLRFPENWILRNSDFARFDVFCLRQSQSHHALIDLCGDLVCIDRWIELERAPIIF